MKFRIKDSVNLTFSKFNNMVDGGIIISETM